MWADSIGAVCDSGSAAGTGRGKGRRAAHYSGRATWKGAKGGADDSSQQAYVEINQQTVDAAEYAQLRGRAGAEHIYGAEHEHTYGAKHTYGFQHGHTYGAKHTYGFQHTRPGSVAFM